MHLIQSLYLLSSFVSVVAMWPQIRQLLVTKQSDELSLSTWISWTIGQIIAELYAVSLHAAPYLIASTSWLLFYFVMLALIIHYRLKPTPVLTSDIVASSN